MGKNRADIKDTSKLAATGLDSIYTEGLSRFSNAESADDDQRDEAIKDIKFAQVEGAQWDEFATKQRKDRPRYTFNRVASAIDDVIGNQRQNEISINVVPDGGGSDKDLARTYKGLIKNIEAKSRARNAYNNAFFEILNGGYGGWRVMTERNDDDSFDQDIKIKPIFSAASSLFFDPSAKEDDKSDALWAFLTTDLAKNEFQARYPNATVTDFGQKKYSNDLCKSWFRDEVVRIAEYWRKVPVDKEIVLTSKGNVYDKAKLEDVEDELALLEGETVVKTRKVKTWRIESYIMNGAEILSGPFDWAGKFIPLVPVYGKRAVIEGREYVRGIVRFAKDPQRVLNYAESQKIEVSALSPKDPYWSTKKKATGQTGQWAKMNTSNDPVLFFTHDEDEPGPPTRGGAPQLQQALIEQAQAAAENVVIAMGVSPQSQRAVGVSGVDRRSEEAVFAQQKMTDLSTFEYYDNLIGGIEHTGRILVDLIPRIIDGNRQETILSPDGTEEIVEVNQTVRDSETGELVILNNLRQGKYSVSVNTGPAFTTQRIEAANQLQKFAAENPDVAPLLSDMIAKNFTTLDSEEIFQRVRRQQIQAGIVEPTEEEREEMGLDQVEQIRTALTQEVFDQVLNDSNIQLILAQAADLTASAQKRTSDITMNQAKIRELVAGIEKTITEADKNDIESNKTALEAVGQQLDNFTKMLQLGIPLTQVDHIERLDQGDVVNVTQDKIVEPVISLANQ
ncbi:hypothetical protein KAR91_09170 [Candidatus Pacearchaeota archaeon]|nr:hypothetical protein [Candidatus Pacearchaeota archaeon]